MGRGGEWEGGEEEEDEGRKVEELGRWREESSSNAIYKYGNGNDELQ